MDDFQKDAKKQMAALEHWMAPIFEKFPHIPQNGREIIVTIAPWLALLGGILGLFGIVTAGMIGSIMSLSMFGYGLLQISMLVSFLASLIAAILDLMAFSPLQKRQKKGWNYIFYAMVVTILASIFAIIVGYGSGALGTIIGALVGFWLMFEVRSLYR